MPFLRTLQTLFKRSIALLLLRQSRRIICSCFPLFIYQQCRCIDQVLHASFFQHIHFLIPTFVVPICYQNSCTKEPLKRGILLPLFSAQIDNENKFLSNLLYKYQNRFVFMQINDTYPSAKRFIIGRRITRLPTIGQSYVTV